MGTDGEPAAKPLSDTNAVSPVKLGTASDQAELVELDASDHLDMMMGDSHDTLNYSVGPSGAELCLPIQRQKNKNL